MKIYLRPHQKKAVVAIEKALKTHKSCLVKMFCGTGKTRIIFRKLMNDHSNLSVVVFPSIALITQFNSDYVQNEKWVSETSKYTYMSICSNDEVKDMDIKYTTDEDAIIKFIKSEEQKIISVTYQSFETFLNAIEKTGITVDLTVFDEAHHVVGSKIQKIVFGDGIFKDLMNKTIFLTATPKNENGIIMLDRKYEDIDYEYIDSDEKECDTYEYYTDCGILAYEYTHYQAVQDDICNDFNIAIDFSMNSDYPYQSVYGAISRCIFSTSNTKCLTFHYRSETAHDTKSHVIDFVSKDNISKFNREYEAVLKEEFKVNKKKYSGKLVVLGITGKTKNKKDILDNFDQDKSNVMVLASCNTIGEGVDTKNANIVCFVDSRTSYQVIIQNVGRVCRKQDNPSTILIPCYVDANKYRNCKTDLERDAIIREDMQKDGNYNGILNVLSALRQDDPELYDLCLNYPNSFAPKEIRDNLWKQGYKIGSAVEDGDLDSILCDLVVGIDIEELEEFEEISDKAGYIEKTLEIHTCSMETPIERYNESEGLETIRLYREKNDDGCDVYRMIEKRGLCDENAVIKKPQRKKVGINVHTNKDVKVLWNIVDDIDFSGKVCQAYIDSTIVEDKWMERLDEVKKFIDENKRRPSSTSKNIDEGKLGRWIGNQRYGYKKIKGQMKNKSNRKKWELFLKNYAEYLKSYDEVWFTTFESLKEYIETNNKNPSNKSTDKQEKRLGSWKIAQMCNYNRKMDAMKDETKRTLWIDFMNKYKKYMKSKDEIWYDTFDDLKKYIDEHKKRPSSSSRKHEEKILGTWFNGQQWKHKNNADCMKDIDRKNTWSSFIKDYSPFLKYSDDIWNDTLEELKSFIHTHKRRPHNTRRTDVDNENKLARWIGTQMRFNVKHDANRKKIWTEFMEEYSEYMKTFDEIWDEHLMNASNFIEHHKRRPNNNSKNKEERTVAQWIGDTRYTYDKNIKNMTNEDKRKKWETFANTYNEYLKSKDDIWMDTFDELTKYIDSNGKRPSQLSKNKDEIRLGSWIGTQQTNYKNKSCAMKDEKKKKIWEKFIVDYAEYMKTCDDIWYTTLDELKKYIDINKKRPGNKSKIIEEKRLGQWFGTQKSCYNRKKDAMKDEKKRKDWCDFLDEYSDYMGTRNDIWDSNLEKLKKFINENGRRPIHESKEDAEKKLARWMGSQQELKINGNHGTDWIVRKDKWDAFLDEYSEYMYSSVEKWDYVFEKLEKYINEHLKRPSRRSNNAPEKELGTFWTLQQRNIKKNKGIVMRPDKFTKWTTFVSKYPHMFDTSYIDLSDTEPEKSTMSKQKEPSKESPKEPLKKQTPKKTMTAKLKQSSTQKNQSIVKTKSKLSALHQKYKTMNSSNLSELFNKEPHLWTEYHEIAEKCEEGFTEEEIQNIPYTRIIKYLENLKIGRKKYIADLGCGKARIHTHFKDYKLFKFYNYDHIAIDDTVISADISNIPLEDNKINIAILCLSMWGSNCKEFIKEGYRILEDNGILLIIEPARRWMGDSGTNRLKDLIIENGFLVRNCNYDDECNDKFMFIECIRK